MKRSALLRTLSLRWMHLHNKEEFMKKSLLAVLALASILLFAGTALAQVSVGIRIGPPPAPRVLRVIPPTPGPGYVWIGGYWYAAGGKYRWHAGYWTLPPYAGARWVPARHDGTLFYDGYWDGDRGRFAHDHRWDHDHERDRDRFGH
jgi:hypothetical protein